MKVLITGMTGMIGSHFAAACKSRGWDIVGIARSSASSRLEAVDDPHIVRIDLIDKGPLEELFRQDCFDLVAHFGAQAFNSLSWKMEGYTHHVNYMSTLNVLQCVRQYAPQAAVLLACSSAEYGDVKPEECPLTESRLLKPITPYGVSKVVTECLGYQYYANYGTRVFLPRLFIHVGTGHPPATAIQNFARQLALIAKGRIPPVIRVGNLDSARDFVDVRDGVEAMMLILERGQPGIPINVCTGKAVKIAEVLRMLIEISGLNVEVVEALEFFRPSDEPLLLGDNSRLCDLGWRPRYSFRQTLEDVYEDWMKRAS